MKIQMNLENTKVIPKRGTECTLQERPADIQVEPGPGEKAGNIGPIGDRLLRHTIFASFADLALAGETDRCS